MRACFTVVVFGALVAVSGFGCGATKSDGTGGSSGGGSTGAAETSTEFIAQVCAEFSDCCKAAGRPSDGAQCRTLYSALLPTGTFDAAAAGPCLDEIRAAGDKKCAASSMDTPSCSKVFASGGTKKPGEACQDDSECAPADAGRVDCVIDFVNSSSIQQCQLRLTGKVGSSPCVGTVDGNVTFSSGGNGIPTMGYLCDVADGLTCDSGSMACVALAPAGQPCTSGLHPCVATAYCSFADNTCKDRLGLGAVCETDDACQAGAYCEPTRRTCVAQTATGQTCSSSAECLSNNCTNQKCSAQDDLSLAFLCGGN